MISRALLASSLSLAAANFESPGLGKCLDLKAELKEDGTRETLADMEAKTTPIEVQLYTCHGDHNQHFEIVGGFFKSFSLTDDCLTADAIADNANVHLEPCKEGEGRQQWDLTGDGYVKVKGSDKCLDVVAEMKDDGSREVWHEIKAHTMVNVHLYTCHDPETTDRVNQLWRWVPWINGEEVTEKTASGSTGEEVTEETASGSTGAAGSACTRPSDWCASGDTYTDSTDCDDDGIPDPHCARDGHIGFLGSASGCADTWPWATCQIAGSACTRPNGWCAIGDTYTDSIDCDGDGIPDPHCAQGGNSGYLASASACAETWPSGTCQASVNAKYTMEYKALGVARSVVFPGLCAAVLAFAAVAGAVVGLKRWRKTNSPSLPLIAAEE